MADGVLKKVAAACREAMLAGMPILYIKTDSDIFINRLVLMEDKPLVVLVNVSGQGGCDGKARVSRPLGEKGTSSERTLPNAVNFYHEVPNVYRGGDNLYSRCEHGPAIWACKMPEKPGDAGGIMKRLEAFVTDRENPAHRQYDVLQSSVVILYSLTPYVSPMLQAYTEIIDVPYPDEEEIRGIIKSVSAGRLSQAGGDMLSSLCTYFLGFTEEEIVITMQQIMSVKRLDEMDEAQLKELMVETVCRRKKQKLEGGILEYCELRGRIGGMERYKEWLKKQKGPLQNSNAYRRSIGTPPPKGVLMCGIPGCGKSAAARFTAQELGLELLRMDVGSLMDRFQGMSEQRMRDALRMAETVSPCVLWLDELEKGFSAASGDGDNGSFKRMFGYMLSWMQENTKPCFIFATANDIGQLPKEFFRSGRFDALFAVYLPTAEECADILKVSMEKRIAEAARARRADAADVAIFSGDCADPGFLLDFVNENLTGPGGRPRIVVGSDLDALVSLALRALQKTAALRPITRTEWGNAMRQVLEDDTFVTYGQGEENIDAIAVSYCRLLRKGFIPTSKDALFGSSDYHRENLDRMRGRNAPGADGQDPEKCGDAPQPAAIRTDSGREFANSYDWAVSRFLRGRINEAAAEIEMNEREKLYRG